MNCFLSFMWLVFKVNSFKILHYFLLLHENFSSIFDYSNFILRNYKLSFIIKMFQEKYVLPNNSTKYYILLTKIKEKTGEIKKNGVEEVSIVTRKVFLFTTRWRSVHLFFCSGGGLNELDSSNNLI